MVIIGHRSFKSSFDANKEWKQATLLRPVNMFKTAGRLRRQNETRSKRSSIHLKSLYTPNSLIFSQIKFPSKHFALLSKHWIKIAIKRHRHRPVTVFLTLNIHSDSKIVKSQVNTRLPNWTWFLSASMCRGLLPSGIESCCRRQSPQNLDWCRVAPTLSHFPAGNTHWSKTSSHRTKRIKI